MIETSSAVCSESQQPHNNPMRVRGRPRLPLHGGCRCCLAAADARGVRADLIRPTLLSLLRKYDSDEPHYFGRPLQEEGYPAFVGGGAGIVLSRAAGATILAVKEADECSPLNLKWNDRIHQVMRTR